MNNSASDKKNTEKSSKRKIVQKDPDLKSTIVCQCGKLILVVPDVKEMDIALELHLIEHKKKYKLSDDEAEAILDDLIAQVFNKLG